MAAKSKLTGKEQSATLLIGGLSLKDQKRELLARKPSLIVASLGRVTEVLDKGYLGDLSSLGLLVIDEADRFRVTGND